MSLTSFSPTLYLRGINITPVKHIPTRDLDALTRIMTFREVRRNHTLERALAKRKFQF